MKITTENGHTYDLDASAISALRAAKHAGEAETAFNQLAPHVPRKDRCGVWVEV